jgi:hypothetical protein
MISDKGIEVVQFFFFLFGLVSKKLYFCRPKQKTVR